MAAFGNVTVTEKTVKPSAVAVKGNCVYERTVKFVIPANSTVAAGDLLGLKVPPGTLFLGGTIKPSESLGSTTVALSTSEQTFVAAAVVTGERSLAPAAGASLLNKTGNTTDLQVTCTLAAATSPASDVTVELTLVLAQIGPSTAPYTTFTI